MTTYVALLRGINVGKAKRVAMADLREILADLGHRDVSTILMSGNAVFTSSSRSAADIARGIERAIDERLGLEVAVFVRTAAQLQAVVDANPMPDEAERDPGKLHVAFFDEPVDRKALGPVLEQDWSPERVAVGKGGGTVYGWYPDGMTGSKLAEALGKVKGPKGTDRNWNTVRKLLAKAQGQPQ